MKNDKDRIKEACKNTLIQLRGTRSLTQEVLSDRSGVTRQHISRLETAQKVPRLDTLAALSNGFGIPFSEFLTTFLEQYETLLPVTFKKAASSAPVWKTGAAKKKKPRKSK